MDRRGQPRRPNNREPEENEAGGWGFFAAAGAAIAAGAYLFSRLNEESSSTTSSSTTTTTSSTGMPHRVTHSSRSATHTRTVRSNPGTWQTIKIENAVVLAIDATPTQGGGILRTSNGGRKILYFYSVNWSNYFEFPQQSDKFEMINALLALLALKVKIENLKRLSWDSFVIKVDNNFITSQYSDPQDNEALQCFKAELADLNGTAEKISQGYDSDMKNANQLSRGGATEWIRSKLQEHYDEYTIYDVSDEVESYLERNLNIVPKKYHLH